MNNRKHSSRKAVSPLIASVLLIVFVIGISTIILSWLTSYTKDATDDASTKSDGLVSCTGGIIGIQRIYFMNASDTDGEINQTIKIIINNEGSIPVDITQIMLTNRTGDTCEFDINATTINNGKSLQLLEENTCPGFLDLNNLECSDLDTVLIRTTCAGTRATIKTYEDSKVQCRH
ncbi:MAG: hypothetical protein KAJ54_00985 [Candidatus Aenigmarchaeota archaeon]|nr:hypothetical protein [Candidatus Aenigmarchaeota archaeon]